MIKHTGGCHCGRVKFEVTAPAVLKVSACNCSICSKAGYLHPVVPGSTCGIKSFYVPRSHPDGFSINARCLDADTVELMEIGQTNGREWEKVYPDGRGEYSA